MVVESGFKTGILREQPIFFLGGEALQPLRRNHEPDVLGADFLIGATISRRSYDFLQTANVATIRVPNAIR
jgi:hypothetical protein